MNGKQDISCIGRLECEGVRLALGTASTSARPGKLPLLIETPRRPLSGCHFELRVKLSSIHGTV